MAVRMKVHGGDFSNVYLNITFGQVSLTTGVVAGTGERIKINSQTVAELALATEESVKRIGGTLGWGAAGALTLGPIGLAAGLLAGGRKKEVTYILILSDGRSLVATVDNQAYAKLLGASKSKP